MGICHIGNTVRTCRCLELFTARKKVLIFSLKATEGEDDDACWTTIAAVKMIW
jgi:hypothetical protein